MRGEFNAIARHPARLAQGVTLPQAEQEMNAMAGRLAPQYPADRDLGIVLVGLHEHLAGPFKPAFLLLTGAVAGVLLIACANVAGMLTARGAARKREVGTSKGPEFSRR